MGFHKTVTLKCTENIKLRITKYTIIVVFDGSHKQFVYLVTHVTQWDVRV